MPILRRVSVIVWRDSSITVQRSGAGGSLATFFRSLPRAQPSYPRITRRLQSREAFSFDNRRSSLSLRSADQTFGQVKDCKTLEEAIDFVHKHLRTSTNRNLSAFWSAASRLLRESRDSRVHSKGWPNEETHLTTRKLTEIFTMTSDRLGRFHPRDLSTTSFAFSKIINHVERNARGDEKKKVDYARVFNSILVGEHRTRRDLIFDFIANAAVRSVQKFDARGLSNTVYSFALIGYQPNVQGNRPFLKIMAGECLHQLNHFKMQELSNLVWSYAKLDHKNPELFGAVASRILELDPKADATFNPQVISNILWSFAALEETNEDLFRYIANNIMSTNSLRKYKPQHLATIVRAYARADLYQPMLLSRIAEHVIETNFESFTGHAYSSLIRSYVVAGHDLSELLNLAADSMCQRDMKKFSAQSIANIIWSYATAREWCPDLFVGLIAAAIDRRDEFQPQETANLLWACATLGQTNADLFGAFVPIVKSRMDDLTSQGLANAAWAFAVADMQNNDLNDRFLAAFVKSVDRFSVEGLSQLHQWQLWQTERASSVQLPGRLSEKCRDAFVSQVTGYSKLQDQVVSVLSRMDFDDVLEEYRTRNTGYTLDALVSHDTVKIGIEINGPYHYIGGRNLNGGSKLKLRQVSSVDRIRVVSVPHYEWEQLDGDEGRKKYLLSALGGESLALVT